MWLLRAQVISAAGVISGGTIPDGALVLDGKPLMLDGKYLVLVN